MNRTKRLLTLLLLVCGMTTGAWAQTAQLIRDGYLIKTFTGASSLSSAISAAANKGDIIILSSGSFSNPGNITKSVSIYGQGFENSTAIGGERTYISGKIEFKLMSEGALDGIHLEGLFIDNDLNILTNIGTTAIVDDFTVKKCHSGGVFFYQRSTNVILQNCKFDRDVRTYPDSYTTTMQVNNCYIEGNLFNFADGSNIIVNNSLIHNNWYQNYSAATSFNNCIIYKNISNGSSATKCIFNLSSVSGSTDNCWMGVNNGDIYVADGEDGTYSESKSFAVKDIYVGTDDTPVGPQGGIGWNKTPTIPSYSIPEDLPQDAEGYYLLSTKINWMQFADIVMNTNASANARMTADIDLGDDQTKIGDDVAYTNPSTQNANNPFKGVFDGQGHTLTVKYTTATGKFPSPFPNINGATIKNLHIAGSIVSTTAHAGGVVSASWGTDHLENVWVSATISSQGQSWDECGAIVACMKKGTLTLNDCLFTGDMTSTQSYNGCFVGYCNAGSTTVTNCLSTGTFTYGGSSMSYGAITHNNSYVKQFPTSIPSAMQVTDVQLADGTITTALQNNREETVWVQDPLTNQPMLALFAGKYKVPTSGLGTFSSKTNFNLPEGLEAYYCKNYDSTEGTIGVVAIDGVVPAETGVLLKGEPGETYTITASSETPSAIDDNALVAVTEQTTIQQIDDSYTNFGLSSGAFKKVNAKGGTVKANRAYLQLPTSALTSAAQARGITLVWDEDVTSIRSIDNGQLIIDNYWYTLDGCRLNGKPTAKGIYIVNGKKVVIN